MSPDPSRAPASVAEKEPRFSLRRSLLYRGAPRTLGLAWRIAAFHLRRGWGAARPQAFDWEYGVETAPDPTLSGSRKAAAGGVYGPVDTASFTEMLRRGGIRAAIARQPFDFFDFGCGRGRALLLASEYPFARIRGVEYDRALLESARRNVGLWLAHRPAGGRTRRRAPGRVLCRDIALEWDDAAAWAIPEPPSPAVFFFNEPVGAAALSRIAGRIRASLAQAPRPAFVIYLGGRYAPVWEDAGDFVPTYTHGDDRVYRWTQNQARAAAGAEHGVPRQSMDGPRPALPGEGIG